MEPRPGPLRLEELHGSEDYFEHPYFADRRQTTPGAAAAAEARLQRIEKVSGPIAGKRLVDVGSDVGLFVEHAQERWGMVASGVDITKRVVEIGRARGRDLHQGTLETVRFERESVDVVTGFDLIEHVDDPAAFLAEVHRILKPNGVVSLETPNYDGLIYRVGRMLDRVPPLRPCVRGLQERLWPPFHVQYFTRRSLGDCLRQAGFESMTVEGRELAKSELAVVQPLIRAAVLGLFAGAQALGMPTLLVSIAEKK